MAIDPSRQLPLGVTTSNEAFFDALIRHQIGLLRLSGGIRDKILKLLNASEQDIADKIRARLAGHIGLNTPASVRRLNLLLKTIRAIRLKSWKGMTAVWVSEMRELARTEPAFISGALKTVVPVVLETTIPSASLLSSIVTTRPFQGKTLRQWARNARLADIRRIEDQIKIGMVQGEGSAAIARRVVGTALFRGANGVTEITRRQATVITRTAVNAIANQAKREFYVANKKLFREELYVATLDSRTTNICMSLDGRRFPVGEGPIPPVHIQCRSLRIAVINDETIGRRPARAFTERQLLREFARNKGIPAVTTRGALGRGLKGPFDQFKVSRIRELTGRVPAKVSYQEWLGRQSRDFQNDVLGKTRAVLFRKGKLPLDKFVNRAGDQLTLSQLATLEKRAFLSAGLNPEDFL